MIGKLDFKILSKMLTEEWRIHTDLFGGIRFALFPVVILLLGATTVWTLLFAGVETATIVVAVHLLVFLFGLHTGSIGFIGSEAIKDLLGDITYIAFGAEMLPLSKQRLLGIFIVKDAIYYSLLFLTPVVLSLTPAIVDGSLTVAEMFILWVSFIGTFLLGAATTIALIGLTTRGVSGKLVSIVLAVTIGGAFLLNIDISQFTPYGFYTDPSVLTALTGFVPIPIVGILGVAVFDFSSPPKERTTGRDYKSVSGLFPGENPLMTKTLIDLIRSSGGVMKVMFSGGIIFLVSIGLIWMVEQFLIGDPSTPISMAAMLSLMAFTTYNWLTQFDAIEDYFIYPVDEGDVYREKFIAFLLVSIPSGLFYYALTLILYEGTFGEILAGVVIVIGVQIYLFGVTVRLAGMSPNEFLFDTLKFSLFTIAVSCILVPILIAGLVMAPLSFTSLAIVSVFSVISAILGVGLYWQQ